MNIEENNKLIAEFMEIELFGEEKDHTEALLICSALDLSVNPCTHFENVQETVHLDDMKFHSSWDWLMPVVEKIESECDIHLYADNNLIDNVKKYWDINEMYKAVVEFIKWYNEQPFNS